MYSPDDDGGGGGAPPKQAEEVKDKAVAELQAQAAAVPTVTGCVPITTAPGGGTVPGASVDWNIGLNGIAGGEKLVLSGSPNNFFDPINPNTFTLTRGQTSQKVTTTITLNATGTGTLTACIGTSCKSDTVTITPTGG